MVAEIIVLRETMIGEPLNNIGNMFFQPDLEFPNSPPYIFLATRAFDQIYHKFGAASNKGLNGHWFHQAISSKRFNFSIPHCIEITHSTFPTWEEAPHVMEKGNGSGWVDDIWGYLQA